jgi:hypothetical protein
VFGRKKPKLKHEPSGPQVRTGPTVDYRTYDIGWQFRILDPEGPFGWHVCDRETLIGKIHDRIKSVESMRWGEILGKNLHAIETWKLAKAARDRLEVIGQDDVDELYTLRVEKKRRIWGIRDRMFFKVLWWDPEHQVYEMNIADN